MRSRDAPQSGADTKAFFAALSDLERALELNEERTRQMHVRIGEIRDAIESGRSLREVVHEEQTPLVVELLTQCADTLHEYGSRVRRTEARALHGEGLTMDEIARLFGVTRQRISALLRERS